MHIIFTEEEIIALVENEFNKRFPNYSWSEIVAIATPQQKPLIRDTPYITIEVRDIEKVNSTEKKGSK